MNKKSDGREDQFEDEVRPEDGLVRHWMFLNGETLRLLSALPAALCGVFWCFLYILGAGQSIVGIILLTLALISFFAWRLLDRQVREYEESGWKKDKHSPRRDRVEIRIAVALWLFIFLGFGTLIMLQVRR